MSQGSWVYLLDGVDAWPFLFRAHLPLLFVGGVRTAALPRVSLLPVVLFLHHMHASNVTGVTILWKALIDGYLGRYYCNDQIRGGADARS